MSSLIIMWGKNNKIYLGNLITHVHITIAHMPNCVIVYLYNIVTRHIGNGTMELRSKMNVPKSKVEILLCPTLEHLQFTLYKTFSHFSRLETLILDIRVEHLIILGWPTFPISFYIGPCAQTQ
jgi:hypothetical protein